MKKRTKKKVDPLAIEKQEILAEAHTKSIELVRLSRLKYEGNDLTFIDLRVFQRGSDDDGNDVYYPTTKGIHVQERDFEKLLQGYLNAGPLQVGNQVH